MLQSRRLTVQDAVAMATGSIGTPAADPPFARFWRMHLVGQTSVLYGQQSASFLVFDSPGSAAAALRMMKPGGADPTVDAVVRRENVVLIYDKGGRDSSVVLRVLNSL
jgi:hypothetical protein